jgi:uncharacterized Zn-finger protein
MALKILCAGCSKDEREEAEAIVKRALAEASARVAWTVSLVKLGEQWSVTADAPEAQVRARTAVVPGSGLAAALTQMAAKPTQPAPATAAPVAASAMEPPPTPMAGMPSVALPKPAEKPGAIACGKCSRRFVVVYESIPGEPLQEAPVACPYCWSLNRVQVGAEAAAASDYRADKVD